MFFPDFVGQNLQHRHTISISARPRVAVQQQRHVGDAAGVSLGVREILVQDRPAMEPSHKSCNSCNIRQLYDNYLG